MQARLGKSRSSWRGKRTQFRHSLSGRSTLEDCFFCKNCNNFVPSDFILSGVRNRNHCPYCLCSCHYDLFAAGDRLSACRSPMEPIGLTFKTTWKKYGPCRGELMLIHVCTECAALSINRIAADDDPETILKVFEDSLLLDATMVSRLNAEGILPLSSIDRDMVSVRLFGQSDGSRGIMSVGRLVGTG